MKPHHSLLLFLALFSSAAHAQLKTGSNPNSVAGTSNFEVEATNGNKFIIGKATGAMTFTDGNQAAGKVLTSDAGGNAAWAAPSSQLESVAITSLTSPGTYPTGSMVYNTAAVEGVPVGPVVWTGSSWAPVGSQNITTTVSGGYTTGYDLSGLSSTLITLVQGSGNGQFNTNSKAESTVEGDKDTCDVTATMMQTSMDALPDGGVIKLRFPTVTIPDQGTNGNTWYLDMGLPPAAGYAGKVFYIHADVSSTVGLAFAPQQGWPAVVAYGAINPSASNKIFFVTNNVYNFVNTQAGVTLNQNMSSVSHTNLSGLTVRPTITPILRLTAINTTTWIVESKGYYAAAN